MFSSFLQDLLIGCILAVCGNLLISISLNLQVKLVCFVLHKHGDFVFPFRPIFETAYSGVGLAKFMMFM